MRELKPRAWSIDAQKWCSRVDYDGYKEQWTGIVAVTSPEVHGKYIGEYVAEPGEIILELPTGLKDKNGREIYEGDIVRDDDFGDIGEVEYYAPNFTFHPMYPIERWNSHYIGMYIKVIGNIHENPELLEEEK